MQCHEMGMCYVNYGIVRSNEMEHIAEVITHQAAYFPHLPVIWNVLVFLEINSVVYDM